MLFSLLKDEYDKGEIKEKFPSLTYSKTHQTLLLLQLPSFKRFGLTSLEHFLTTSCACILWLFWEIRHQHFRFRSEMRNKS